MPPSDNISQIAGNASDDIKRIIGNFFQNYKGNHVRPPVFGESIQERMKVVEISLNRKAEEEKKLEARVVVELDVTEGHCIRLRCPEVCYSLLFFVLDMLNGGGNIHGGCSAYLVDM